jgi:hypothetical protein
MSIIGILSSNLFSTGTAQNTQNTQGTRANAPRFEQIKEEFQQLGQDLQSGNLTQAQSDFATLSKNFPGASQNSATTLTSAATTTPAAGTTGSTSLVQQFAQLGQDLQSGNLQAAQKDFTNLQQTAQQDIGQQIQGHHRHGHHHHGGGTEFASSSSSRQSNPISQAFSKLGQDLQAGNLSGAQSAFATLQNDLQQIGGFVSSGSSGTGGTTTPSSSAASTSAGSLNVTA